VSSFCFRHTETGAELHMSIPWGAASADDSNERETLNDSAAAVDTMGYTDHFVEEQDHEDSGPDEFEDDGFIVGEDDDDADDDVDDDELCCICRDGGSLIICDGGDVVPGCGCNFHIGCIKRDVIPPGDWICKGCATNFGIDDVGVEGHEFVEDPNGGEDKPDETQGGRLKRKKQETITVDSSDDEDFGRRNFSPEVHSEHEDGDVSDKPDETLKRRLKRKQQETITVDSSDEEGFGGGGFSPEVHEPEDEDDAVDDDESPPKVAPAHRAKRQRIIDSDDDDE
jgi:hypothetical protein